MSTQKTFQRFHRVLNLKKNQIKAVESRIKMKKEKKIPTLHPIRVIHLSSDW